MKLFFWVVCTAGLLNQSTSGTLTAVLTTIGGLVFVLCVTAVVATSYVCITRKR